MYTYVFIQGHQYLALQSILNQIFDAFSGFLDFETIYVTLKLLEIKI